MNADFENHVQWTSVKSVCEILHNAGYEAMLAGGCVRDLIMKRVPNDFDIATSAKPEDVERLFPRAIGVGRAFGVIIIPFDDFQLEVATFREDDAYLDGRHPQSVRFSSAEQDARRRDFTINALFYDLHKNEVIDYVDGRRDISERRLRTVGIPQDRFREDKLRLLRAVRFAAQLEFEIESETLAAVAELAAEIHQVSRERVRDELLKILSAKARLVGLQFLRSTGLLRALFGLALSNLEVDRYFIKRHDGETEVVRLALFFYALFADLRGNFDGAQAEREIREEYLKSLKLENRTIDAVLFCFRHLPQFLEPSSIREGEMLLLLLHPHAGHAEIFASAIFGAILDANLDAKGETISRDERQLVLLSLKEKLQAQLPRDNPSVAGQMSRPTAYLTGDDVRDSGVKPGPKTGLLLQEAYLRQLEGEFEDRQAALRWIQTTVKKESSSTQ